MKKSTIYTLSLCLLTAPFASTSFGQPSKVEEIEVSTEETRTVTFLGVETSRISGALRNHIDLPEGVGLTISHIAEDSGAAEADLQQYDILHKVDDQIIINQEQLRTYIRSKNAGDTVRLEILRKGKILKVPVKLGQREERKHRPFGEHWPFPNPMPKHFGPNGGNWNFNFDSEEFKERMEEFSKQAAEIGNRALQFIPEVIIEHEEDDGSKRVTTVGRGPHRVVFRKDNLVAEMINEKGQHTYILKEVNGEDERILYEGEEPTEEDLEKLSEEARVVFKRLKESPSLNFKDMDKMMKEKTRIIINTGDDEANLTHNFGPEEEA